jgi:hypothetical protein
VRRWTRFEIQHRYRHLARRPTAPWRRPPEILGLGAQKAGTTTIWALLRQHPGFAAPTRKEVRYFTRQRLPSWNWYRSHFPIRDRHVPSADITPEYLLIAGTARRTARLLPDARLIVTLRDPVARAWSHYRMMCRRGDETRTFVQALRDPSPVPTSHAYAERGDYAGQLRAWRTAFPDNPWLIIEAEQMFGDLHGAAERLYAFCGLPPHEPADVRPRAQGGKRAPVPDEARRVLAARYADTNADLEAVAGRRFSWL